MALFGSILYPVIAVQSYLSVRPNSEGPLLVRSYGSPLTRDQLVRLVKRSSCQLLDIDSSAYSRQRFRIVAASAAAAIQLSSMHMILHKPWVDGTAEVREHVYIRTPREALISYCPGDHIYIRG